MYFPCFRRQPSGNEHQPFSEVSACRFGGGGRGRKEILDLKKEVFELEEPHDKSCPTDRDHIPCAALGINKKPLKLKFESVVR